MTIEKLGYNYYHIYDIIFGQLVSHTYLYYNKRQSIRLFKKQYGQRKRVERIIKEIYK